MFLGIGGASLFLIAWGYTLRKHLKFFKSVSIKAFVNFHIFISFLSVIVLGFHSQLSFERPMAYWLSGSMLVLIVSGMLGQYLYIRLPRDRHGLEEDLESIETEKEKTYMLFLVQFNKNPQVLETLKIIDETMIMIDNASTSGLIQMISTDINIYRQRKKIRDELAISDIDPQLKNKLMIELRKYITISLKLHFLHLTKKLTRNWLIFHKGFIGFTMVLIFIHVYTVLQTRFYNDWPWIK